MSSLLLDNTTHFSRWRHSLMARSMKHCDSLPHSVMIARLSCLTVVIVIKNWQESVYSYTRTERKKNNRKTKNKTFEQTWVCEGSPVDGTWSMVWRICGKVCFKFRVEESGSDGWWEWWWWNRWAWVSGMRRVWRRMIRMTEWMNGWMDGWMDGWMNEWIWLTDWLTDW